MWHKFGQMHTKSQPELYTEHSQVYHIFNKTRHVTLLSSAEHKNRINLRLKFTTQCCNKLTATGHLQCDSG